MNEKCKKCWNSLTFLRNGWRKITGKPVSCTEEKSLETNQIVEAKQSDNPNSSTTQIY